MTTKVLGQNVDEIWHILFVFSCLSTYGWKLNYMWQQV